MYPKILDLGSFTIHTYGVMLALAFIAGIWLTCRNAKGRGIDPDQLWNLGLIAILAALIGSRVLLFFSDYSYYSQNPREIFSLSALRSTAISVGGLILALLASILYLRRVKLSLPAVGDLAAPGLALGQAIAYLGCLSAGCCYGRPTSLFWGITFTDSYAGDSVGVPLFMALHPTQIYQAAGALTLLVYLLWRLGRIHFSGQIFLEYLAGDGILGFVIGFFRGDDPDLWMRGLLSASQIMGIIAVLGSFLAYRLLHVHQGEA
jgi:phosphatidylglycerol:prolipoprotein diacylglycerol transferase